MIRVLVVDDSAFMRKILSDILNSDPDIEVIATAINGKYAVRKAIELHPDVIAMDLEMPDVNGVEAIKQIMKDDPVPIIAISAHSETESNITFDAMKAGAIDFILKPSGEISIDMTKVQQEIIHKVKMASKAQIRRFKPVLSTPKRYRFSSTSKKIIVIGASMGGPQTLTALLTEIPKNIPSPILIVQHMPPVFTKSFAERLNAVCDIEVREAKDGDIIRDGLALIAPGGFHMELEPNKKDKYKSVIRLNMDPPELGVRPCINKLFISVAKIFKDNTIGVILTGMGNDGTLGSKELKSLNGTVIAEAEESCIIYGMPKEVINSGYADLVLNLNKIAVALVQLVDV